MNIVKEEQGTTLNVRPEGRLDTNTSKELEQALAPEIEKYDAIVLDFSELQYLSSAGLRVLLSVQKKMKGKEFRLTNVNSNVMEVFEITGFVDFLNID